MLRLYLRLYVILALGLAGAIWLVNYGLDAYMPESNETYNREALRGPAWALVEQLRPVQGAARQARLDELQPHYGLRLKLVQRGAQHLSEREQKLLANDQVVVREDFMKFLAPIDDGAQLLEIRLPEEPKWLYLWAYGLLGVSLAIVLYFWVRPHWRDLEHIRLAAQRFGDNDLGSRILLPRRSTVRALAGHFNQMAERIESLIANQRELTNAVSHELRTPIARLSFELDQLKQQADPRQSRQLIADMYADLGELEEMVSELLTYASLERGATQVTRENIEAQSWLDSVIGSVTLEAEAAGVQLSLRTCEVDVIQIEPRFMARALINLLRNAIRYADRRVEVSLVKFGSGYEVRVDDDGPGVPLEGRTKIFEPFLRLDTSRDRRTGGFGLGLALVKRVSQWHGGQVHVLDSEWGGASFRMTWAYADPARLKASL
ncbi:Sensor protein RstB [Pseudomonas sp. 31 R 17]|uniref:ATP-binding protein n=1 Tax=Pseudomonas sp. 31 R 17 TaxID=1844101 RepID=UPI000811FEAE|nr:ATP-binding protein [Pseudomonas sp. 31 R 17]CRM34515.1 Sensor protein RstB [Pseudomonas sp. 31 R 17]